MAVAYEGYHGKALEAAVKLVADEPVFTALVSPTASLDRVVEIDGGMEDSQLVTAVSGATFARTVALWAHVLPSDGEFDVQPLWESADGITYEGSIPVAFNWIPPGTITLRHERLRYVISKTSLICQGIQNQKGQAGKWRKILATPTGCHFLDAAGAGRGVIRSQITIQFGDKP